ncbi:MAG: helix-turn-helix domain-containing protein [Peptococcaceae bacterium]|nr:helix-turn-helix domain-containing protein [Peptococcaceae bacterium]
MESNNIHSTVYTVEEIGLLLGIGKNKAYELVNSGVLRSVRVGRRILIPKSSFNQWLMGVTESRSEVENEN